MRGTAIALAVLGALILAFGVGYGFCRHDMRAARGPAVLLTPSAWCYMDGRVWPATMATATDANMVTCRAEDMPR